MEHKRKRSGKSVDIKGTKGIAIALTVVCLIAVIAGVIAFSPLGQKLLQSVIKPVFSCSGTKEEDQKIVSALSQQDEKAVEHTPVPQPTPKETRESVMIEEIQFFILQMGAFTDRNAAEEHAGQIQRMGGGGLLYTDGSVYRVFAAAYLDETSLIKVQSQVRADGFEATPYITDKKALKITFEGDPVAVAALKGSAGCINEIPSKLSSMCISFDKGELEEESLTEQIDQLCKRCSTCIEDMTGIPDASVSPIRELMMKYQEKLSTFLREHDTIETRMISSELKHLQLSVIADYILFFERK